MLPRQPRSPHNPIPNPPFSYTETYYLQGDSGILPLGEGLYLNPITGAFTTVQPPPPPQPFDLLQNTVFYYDFGNSDCYPGSGTSVFDLGPLGNDGLIYGPIAYSPLGGGSFDFPDNEEVVVALEYEDPELDVESQFSYVAWVRPQSSSGYQSIIDRGNDNFLFCTYNGKLQLYNYSRSVETLPEGEWVQVAVCYQYPGTTEIYVDGEIVRTGPSFFEEPAPSSLFAIGSGLDEFPPEGANETWVGQIAIAAAYNIKLTPGNIQYFYTNSLSRFNP